MHNCSKKHLSFVSVSYMIKFVLRSLFKFKNTTHEKMSWSVAAKNCKSSMSYLRDHYCTTKWKRWRWQYSEGDDDSKDNENSGYDDNGHNDDDDDDDEDNDDSGGSVSNAVSEGNNDDNNKEVQISDILCTSKSGRTCRAWKGQYLYYWFC